MLWKLKQFNWSILHNKLKLTIKKRTSHSCKTSKTPVFTYPSNKQMNPPHISAGSSPTVYEKPSEESGETFGCLDVSSIH